MSKINKILPRESEFTSVIGSIAHMPTKLYYRGVLPEKRVKSVAIVGTRKPTAYGQEFAYKLARELAEKGVVVVSGLALGIDAVAHRGALDAGGVTVAVLGSGIDDITPRTNKRLGERILDEGGAILSEYEPGHPAMPGQFLARNRIVSGLSDAVIVIEAAKRSGTLATASYGLNQGKSVFALPGRVSDAMSAGCLALLKQGATPVACVEDVLEVIAPEKLEQVTLGFDGDSEVERKIVKMIRSGVNDGEVIAAGAGVSVGEFNQAVTMMELKGTIRALGANRWMLR
ncbi:DNA-processing protein DprA [Candidatus Saccharibacteria bacterium]|nr:DNA-processing protein DprA [Candidatus Saccharibacteria bacterium]